MNSWNCENQFSIRMLSRFLSICRYDKDRMNFPESANFKMMHSCYINHFICNHWFNNWIIHGDALILNFKFIVIHSIWLLKSRRLAWWPNGWYKISTYRINTEAWGQMRCLNMGVSIGRSVCQRLCDRLYWLKVAVQWLVIFGHQALATQKIYGLIIYDF